MAHSRGHVDLESLVMDEHNYKRAAGLVNLIDLRMAGKMWEF